MTGPSDFDRMMRSAQWMIDNPQFEEKPASILEFMGPDYLNIIGGVRQKVVDALVGIFGLEVSPDKLARVEEALFTGGIGIGKTTLASIALPYMVHWVLCMRNPQQFFGMLPGTKLAFMQMSTSEQQAREVVFSDIQSRIDHGIWFQKNSMPDPRIKRQIKFPDKDIWILPGDSSEKTFEGYNILGGVMDEIDSYTVTKNKDLAEVGYSTIKNRITSRFGDRGLLILIGQMKSATGFASRRLEEYSSRPDEAFVSKLSIWEAKGWDHVDMRGKKDRFVNPDGTIQYFYYDRKRKMIHDAKRGAVIAEAVGSGEDTFMKIPMLYFSDFTKGPDKALRDHAGIPPAVNDPFITLVDKIEQCRDRWLVNHNPADAFLIDGSIDETRDDIKLSAAGPEPYYPTLANWFNHNWYEQHDSRKRVVAIDTATSGDGDALGFAMGFVDSLIDLDGEEKPYIIIDLLYRVKAPKGQAIALAEIRNLIYYLKNDLGFNIKEVTLDGFESTDTMQLLSRRGINAHYLSVDRKKGPYEDLREAIYEGRLEFPRYLTYKNKGDDKQVEILIKELMELSDNGQKIDHPDNGSKDVADALAAVVYNLMTNRGYRRGADTRGSTDLPILGSTNPMPVFKQPVSALPATPLPPVIGTVPGIVIPDRLKPTWG